MRERTRQTRPKPWSEYRLAAKPRWAIFFYKLEWWMSWAAWALGSWAFLEVLEYLGTFSLLIAVAFYFSESGDRLKQKHYQAWEVIDAAQGKGGSGGRIEALQELNKDRVSLIGIEASGAFLQGILLQRGHLERCDFHASDLRNSDFTNATLTYCNLEETNLRNARLVESDLENADLGGGDLYGANLDRANLSAADLTGADLRHANLDHIIWNQMSSLHLANIYGAQHAPEKFVAFAMNQGAVSIESDEQWRTLLQKKEK